MPAAPLSLDRIWPLAGLAGLIPMVTGGCGPGGATIDSFAIERIEFDGDSTLTLTFSKPVANAGEFDPNDFRISLGQSWRTAYTYDGTLYSYEYSGYYDVGYANYDGERLVFASATLVGDDQIVLESATPIGLDACQSIAYTLEYFEMYAEMYEAYGYEFELDMGLFLHHAAGAIPLTSESGEVLPDVGRDWVLSEQDYIGVEVFGFPNLVPRLEIPCP